MANPASKHAWTRAIAVLVCAASVVGCGSIAEDLCDAQCECEGCSDADYDDCVVGYEQDESAADRRDCLDLYDDLVTCRDDTGVCRGADFETDCKSERDRLKSCIGDLHEGGGGDVCLSAIDCGAGKPICGPGGSCVECVENADCGGKKICSGFKCK